MGGHNVSQQKLIVVEIAPLDVSTVFVLNHRLQWSNFIALKHSIAILHLDPATEMSVNPFKPTTYEGDFLLLSCDASGGNPEFYTFSWRHHKLDSWLELPKQTDDHLLVYKLTPDDSGTYQCIARNHGGSATTEIAVQVECKLGVRYLYS